MEIAIVTGNRGLIGSAVAERLKHSFDLIVGIDNDMRSDFFGLKPSGPRHADDVTLTSDDKLLQHRFDIRDRLHVGGTFSQFSSDIKLIVHCAAQPSHDWSATNPILDFDINAVATLGLLEATRQYAPDAHFAFMSTNKVYGDSVNYLPLQDEVSRWDVPELHPLYQGIDESYSIDGTMHSPFGVSKAAADLMVQEYGYYYDLNVGVFRAGCMTGPAHRGARLHGFLSYLMQCAVTGQEYVIQGYDSKQVRDNIHANDVAGIVEAWHNNDGGSYTVYNIGGERHRSCSILEAVLACEMLTGKRMNTRYVDTPRKGDHKWWITDMSRWREDFPDWEQSYTLRGMLSEIMQSNAEAWLREAHV
jgi:CDP-paratose 2-epimerase